ncbi:MAG: methyltransferase type 11 [Bacteroidetes bacterium]|nr:MAG: methyltransferase type 11 [Bacteroidota bacterium]
MSETDKIKARYEKRKEPGHIQAGGAYAGRFSKEITLEREAVYERIIRNRFADISGIRVLEIGAGTGSNLSFFKRLGIKPGNITANELLEDRFDVLKTNHPDVENIPGDALQLPFSEKFDIVFQSTVFTSILDDDFRRKLAGKMFSMVRPGGIVLWYDFRFDNPKNPDVKKVTREEVKTLFPESPGIRFFNVTLAPPIGRRIGGLYKAVNTLFPFLRTHLVAEISR